MEGYELILVDESGNYISTWIQGTNVYYKTVSEGSNTRDVTVTEALDSLNVEIAGITTTLETVTTAIANIISAISNLPTNPTFSIDINPETDTWIIDGLDTDYPSRGRTPVLTVGSDGYWYVDGVKQEAVPARGPQGPQGESGATIYISGEGGGGGGIAGKGSFASAYNYAMLEEDGEQPNRLLLFAWILDDIDENNNTIVKVIYHTGNGIFIDALGARVINSIDGITVQ